MRGMDIFQKPYYREISTMRGRPMRGLPVLTWIVITFQKFYSWVCWLAMMCSDMDFLRICSTSVGYVKIVRIWIKYF